MNSELVRAGMNISAFALIGGSIMMLLSGSALAFGGQVRRAFEPFLTDVRNHTSRSRSELADLSILVAIGLSVMAVFDGNVIGGTAVSVLLYIGRPSVRRATSAEHPLLATPGFLSLDMMIGVYLPFALAHILMFDFFMAASLLTVVVALSWPAGGGESIPGRRWQIAPGVV